MKFSKEFQDKIIHLFVEKAPNAKCPICNYNNFGVLEGIVNDVLQKDSDKFNLNGEYMPSACIVCNNCGFISQHALGKLGLLEEWNQKKDSKETNELPKLGPKSKKE